MTALVGDADPAVTQYVADAAGLGLARLRREPARLQETAERLQRQQRDVAVEQYHVFLQSAEHVQGLRNELDALQTKLDQLVEDLPVLDARCRSFLDAIGRIATARKANSLVLQYHPQLLELLELPQLMETCVRNGYFEEALELDAHVISLRRRLDANPILDSINADMAKSTQLMLTQLVALLQTELKVSESSQLPACLRTVGFLRRINLLSDQELRLTFLQARDVYLQTQLTALPATDPFIFSCASHAQAKRYIDTCRDQLFDIATQYRASFPESGYDGGVLQGWMTMRVTEFIATLERSLSQLTDGASIATLLSHSMYFGLSLGRVGVDFRGLLVAPFERAIFYVFERIVRAGVDQFVAAVRTRRWYAVPIPAAAALPVTPTTSTAADDPLTPPAVLMDHVVLGHLCNAHLAAFNELRHVAALSMLPQVVATVRSGLQTAVTELTNVHAMRSAAWKPEEGRQFAEACRVFSTILLPYILRCLQAIYLNHAVLLATELDVRALVAPLRSIAPAAPTASSIAMAEAEAAAPAAPMEPATADASKVDGSAPAAAPPTAASTEA